MTPIAISCGEPAGIGPDVVAAAHRSLGAELPLLWIGDPRHLPQGTDWREVAGPEEVRPGPLCVLPRDFGAPRVPGRPVPTHAPQVVAAIETGVALALEGRVSALCTAPIHKAALIDGAGFGFPGHTEFLADLCGLGPEEVVMMLACEALRVVPATIHIPLSEVPRALTPERLRATILIAEAALRRSFGLAAPRIAVAGLNPHAGEDGKMGGEEIAFIAPLVAELRARGLDIAGPLPADTMFHDRARKAYDAALAMYHDQALIPLKALHFDEGVNFTLGLPIVRASADHGTAFAIAGTDQALPSATIAALKMAQAAAEHRAASGNPAPNAIAAPQ